MLLPDIPSKGRHPLLAFLAGIPDFIWWLLVLALAVFATDWYSTREAEARVSAYYEAKLKAADDQNDIALSVVRNGQDALISDLYESIATLRTQKPKTITIVKKVTEYVTEKSDAACTIPAGFVWLHDKTLEGERGVAPVSESPPGDVDAPSGVALSTVAATTGYNYAECVERGRVLELWQRWYPEAKRIHEQAKAIAERPIE